MPFAKPLLYVMHYSDYVSYIPCQGRCGVSLIVKPTTSELTELKYRFSFKNTTSVTSENNTSLMYMLSTKMRKMSSADLLDIWNATALLEWDAGKNSVTLLVSIDDDNDADNEEQVCVSSGYNKEEVQVEPTHQNSITTNLIVKWGRNDDETKQPVCMAVETAVNSFLFKVIKLLNEKLSKNA